MRNGAHHRLDYKEMSYWAKQIVCVFFFEQNCGAHFVQALGNADIYEPPEAIIFDRRSKRARPSSGPSSSSKHEIHVHNHFEGTAFGGSRLANHHEEGDGFTPTTQLSSPFRPPVMPLPLHSTSLGNSSTISESNPHSAGPQTAVTPHELQGNKLDTMLLELDTAYLTSKFSAMATTLHDIGIVAAADIVKRDITDLALWTAISPDELSIIQEYAIRSITLDHIGVENPHHLPSAAPAPDGENSDSESIESGVVDSSDTDSPTA
ncbi:hypothetical protein M413DRAFT_113932 [Hebeloma cylindrosporum]|uniref:Uncharacterized protein n=1 Tax=Hebeloma cylindrosporum TaxID=76867 RepID=A0A0C3CZT8_HEBCY|nr:hypothetical protein M413DRAFT_113932 [Hebeloma cylindrosporum h7]